MAAHKKSKISNLRQYFRIRSSIPVRYILVLPENEQNNRRARNSSKVQAPSAQNPLRMAERRTFTLRASYAPANMWYNCASLNPAYQFGALVNAALSNVAANPVITAPSQSVMVQFGEYNYYM